MWRGFPMCFIKMNGINIIWQRRASLNFVKFPTQLQNIILWRHYLKPYQIYEDNLKRAVDKETVFNCCFQTKENWSMSVNTLWTMTFGHIILATRECLLGGPVILCATRRRYVSCTLGLFSFILLVNNIEWVVFVKLLTRSWCGYADTRLWQAF